MAGERKSRLVLLDTNAIIHRAYHALVDADLKTADGKPTGALYGLTSTLIKIAESLKPDYLIACRDMPGKTHRHEVFEAYKAQRAQSEPDLISQLVRAPEVFSAFGIPLYGISGAEADDCLGTIVKEVAHRSDIETIIATGDNDMLQLVSPNVNVYTMRMGITDFILYDEEAVKEKYGFGPEHVIDFKGIKGDPSDNIPGVKGVGDESAKKLIQKYGSLENIIAAIHKQGVEKVAEATSVRKQYIQKILEQETEALFSKELATIKTDVRMQFALPKTFWHLTDHVKTIASLCDALEFKSLKERMLRLAPKKDEDPSLSHESLFAPMTSKEEVDPKALKETSLALWLLRSDYTSPSMSDILGYADTEDFDTAREKIFKDLRASGKLHEVYEKIELPLLPVVEKMNSTGVAVDTKYLNSLAKDYNKELEKISGRIYKHAGHEFNISSPKQLGVVLYDELKLSSGGKEKRTATGARTTREDELSKMREQHQIIDDVLSFRELQKLLSTYIEKIPALVDSDGRLRATFLQSGTVTGRMGCENPNLQNIPIKTEYGKKIREAFTGSKGNVIASIDYSQIELRIAAGLSGDEKLTEVFRSGGDIHTAVATQVFGVPPEIVDHEMRRRAKVINFGILYGMGVNALRENLGNVSRDEAAKYLSEYFKNFSGLSRFVEMTKQKAEREGYTETLFGRRRYFPGFKSPLPQLRAQAERMAVNAPIQGTQADIIKLAMVEADKLIEKEGWKEKAKLVMQVHDELVYELEEKTAHMMARAIRDIMEHVAPEDELSGVPIRAEIAIGKDWGNMVKLKR